jgi:hypothetical protein
MGPLLFLRSYVQIGNGRASQYRRGMVPAYEPEWRPTMEYLLRLYVNENGWSKLTDEQKTQGAAA